MHNRKVMRKWEIAFQVKKNGHREDSESRTRAHRRLLKKLDVIKEVAERL